MTREEMEWIWGRRSVLEALAAGRVKQVLLSDRAQPSPIIREIEAAALARGVATRRAPASELDRLAPGGSAQGVAAEIVAKSQLSLSTVLQQATAKAEPPLLLALDQIQDPQNFGSLLRSAEAAGVDAVVASARRTASLTGSVAKASAGALHHVTIVDVSNLSSALESMKGRGLWIIGLDGNARQTIYETDLTVPLALVIGSEGTGMRRLTKDKSDLLVRIPMRGRVQSLNASVAGAITLFEAVRQRRERC